MKTTVALQISMDPQRKRAFFASSVWLYAFLSNFLGRMQEALVYTGLSTDQITDKTFRFLLESDGRIQKLPTKFAWLGRSQIYITMLQETQKRSMVMRDCFISMCSIYVVQ